MEECTGVKQMTGSYDIVKLKGQIDTDGKSFEEILHSAGLKVEGYENAVRDFSNVELFTEVHIAGHDAMVLGEKIKMAMLFVKSIEGISHNSDEWSELNDCVIGVQVLKRFIEKLNEK